MSDDGALRRFPALIRKGNGIAVSFSDGIWTISVDLQDLNVTPTDAEAPVNLADALAQLIAHDTGTRNITVCDGGFYDVPGSGNNVTCDGGWF